MFERQSALAGVLKSGGRDGPDGQRRLRIGETRGWNLAQIAAFATTLTELESAVRPVFNADLPKRIGKVVNINSRRLLKVGTDQYWVITPDGDDVVLSLRVAMTPQIGVITSLSHSRTCIIIKGTAACEILMKGIALDLHSQVFCIGQFALTGVHHTPVLIHCTGENRYELYVMRTFAQSVWGWLTDAALPVGYDVF